MSADGPPDNEVVPRPPQSLRDDIANWYRQHEEFYRNGPWPDLVSVRDRFERSSRSVQEALVTLSYVHTIATIQTSLRQAEFVYEKIVSGRKTIFHAMLDGSVYNQDANHIRVTLGGDDRLRPMEAIEECTDALDKGQIERALRVLEDKAQGIATRKAPFVLANLGFTSQMCLNLNVADVLNINPDKFSFEEYQEACFRIEELFPDLSQEITEPYHLQWVLFDYNRNHDVKWDVGGEAVQFGLYGQKEKDVIIRPGLEGGPVDHNSWFTSALEPTDEALVGTMDLLEAQATAPMGEGPVGGGLDLFVADFGTPPERPSAAAMGFEANWFSPEITEQPVEDESEDDDTEQSGLGGFLG